MTEESYTRLDITNMSQIKKSVQSNGDNKVVVTLKVDRLNGNDHNLRYRAEWDFNDACEDALTDESINNIIEVNAGTGMDWEAVVKEMANEVVRAYVQNILSDKKIQPLYRGRVKDLIDVKGYEI